MIQKIKDSYVLSTKTTTYIFRVMETGQLEHLYYGAKIEAEISDSFDALAQKHIFASGNTVAYSGEYTNISLEEICLEMSSYGKGDIREPFIEVVHADGSYTSDFVFEKAQVQQGKQAFDSLPGSYDEDDSVEQLCVTLRDMSYGLTLELFYYVYEASDVIARSARLINTSTEQIHLKRLLSTQLDLPDMGYRFTTFTGSWAREMNKRDTLVTAGKMVNASYTGTSSSRANPFVMVSASETTEVSGDCYGFHLIYSGNHYEAVEVSGYDTTRIVTGINPQSFDYILEAGEMFEAPEAVMAYSAEGFTGMSLIMQQFVREHIVRGEWKCKVRPVLLNSWEAAYFDINEKKLLKLAKAAADIGVELFVMDDGWFGSRTDDTQSLGDWTVNEKKLPEGLSGLAKKLKSLGLDFGIWVEPEMVSVNSECFRKHPNWTMEIPGKPHSEGRNQRLLDLANPEVQEYLIEQMSRLFSSADISYVKWDMNRIFSDYYSQYLPASRQGETAHRYVIGLYRVMRELTRRFPKILFEGCAAGGNRFDLGILCYFPQIWASDNTDAASRVKIQTGYSYGYPMSVLSAHVSSSPNHQTLRETPLATRFAVAAFGVCGYECNLSDMKKDELQELSGQIALYKKWREVLLYGDFYRGRSGNINEWCCVSADKRSAIGMLMQNMAQPNTVSERYFPKGLDKTARYHFYNIPAKHNVKGFGDLINTASPVHIKPDSFMLDIVAKFVKLDGEREDYIATGAALMQAGVSLAPAFAATGYNEQIRYFPDYASRLYFMEKLETQEEN